MRRSVARLCILVAASCGYNFLVSGGVFSEGLLGSIAAAWAPPYYALLCVACDARQTRYWPAYHYGLFLWSFWYIALPHYVLRTRGWRGLPMACGFLLLMCPPTLAAALGAWLREDLPDFRP